MSLYAGPAQDDTMAEINVTPFTDVLLVLMIIFIVLAALVVPPGFQKSLNNNCGICGVHTAERASVDISITPVGRIYVGTQAVDQNTVYGALAAIGRRDDKTPIHLIGDRRAPYGPVIRTLDAAKAAGLENVTFVTQ